MTCPTTHRDLLCCASIVALLVARGCHGSPGGADPDDRVRDEPSKTRFKHVRALRRRSRGGRRPCHPDGFCAGGGYRTANGKPYAVVRVHHP